MVFPVIGSSPGDQDAVVVEVNYGGLPGGALVEPGGAIGIVAGDPFPDGLPGGFHRFEGPDAGGRGRGWRDVDDAFPKSVQAEEEPGFLRADELADGPHRAVAAGAFERVAAPGLEDEIASARTQGTGTRPVGRGPAIPRLLLGWRP